MLGAFWVVGCDRLICRADTQVEAGRRYILPCLKYPCHWIYSGYKMTAVSNLEERLVEQKFSASLKFHLETALRKAGAEMHTALIPWHSKVVQDRELLTAQNPLSDKQFSSDFLAMLAARPQTVSLQR